MHKNMPIPLAIHKTSRMIKRYLDCRKKENYFEPSTMNHGRIVGYIYGNSDRDIFQRDIEKEFDIRRSTATNMLKLMEKNGLITRQRTSYDERLKKITLTEYSIKTVSMIDKEMKEVNSVLEKGITKEEREIFFTVLEKINQNIKEADSDD